MSINDYKDSWIASQFELVIDNVRIYLLFHYPQLSDDIDDLCNDTVADLISYTKKKADSLPRSWFDLDASQVSEGEKEYFFRLSYLIAKRRAIDFTRRRTKWISNIDLENHESSATSISQDRQLSAVRIYLDTARIIQELPKKDQKLLFSSLEVSKEKRTLTEPERKQLSRLRKKIGTRLSQKYGESFLNLVKSKYLI